MMSHSRDRTSTGLALVGDLTDRTDSEIVSLFRQRFGEKLPDWALIALGGYGRRDLCPHSDLDLLLLVENRTTRTEIEGVLEELFYPLWDRGFHVSYSVRTTKETLHDARADFFFRTSLIDARLICGSQSLHGNLITALGRDRVLKKVAKFVSDLLDHTGKRHERYGDTSYILEPDLKEGHGGLRDYQGIVWAIRVLTGHNSAELSDLVSHTDFTELDKAYDNILKIRFALHELSGRKNDRLYLEYQEPLAEELGIQGSDLETPAEVLMKHFHRSALTIRSVSDTFMFCLAQALKLTRSPADRVLDEHFHVAAGQLAFRNPDAIQRHPGLIMKAFEHRGETGYPLAPAARSRIRNSLHHVDELRGSSTAGEIFLKILRSPHAGKTLTAMLETGVLERLIPEFEAIKGRTIFDLYHTYTVDLHSINTVAEIRDLETSQPEVFSRIRDRDVLYLSALLHDIGKGYGHSHESVGARTAKPIAARLGLSGEQIELVSFLIENHIVLADLATKRDLSEERVAVEFARRMRDPRRLSMLYLLTVADSKATGPLAWNEWKEALLRELYAKALHVLEKGIFKDPENTVRFEHKWEQLIADIPKELGVKQAGRLWALPQAYVLSSDTNDIKRHLTLRDRLHAPADIQIDVMAGTNQVTLTIITHDRPGLFALLTGILALNHLEIISAKVFTWLDGVAVDVFKVIPPWQDFHEWARIADQFRAATSGNMDIPARLSATRALKTGDQALTNQAQEPTVRIDNDTSDFFTLIEVRAQNRLGMLYHVARIISGFGLNIHRAFVSRNEDLCSDVFYVVDALGEKIEDGSLKQRFAQEMHKVITGFPAGVEALARKNRMNDHDVRSSE